LSRRLSRIFFQRPVPGVRHPRFDTCYNDGIRLLPQYQVQVFCFFEFFGRISRSPLFFESSRFRSIRPFLCIIGLNGTSSFHSTFHLRLEVRNLHHCFNFTFLTRAPFGDSRILRWRWLLVNPEKKLDVNDLSTILENLHWLSFHGDRTFLQPPLILSLLDLQGDTKSYLSGLPCVGGHPDGPSHNYKGTVHVCLRI
jgi:hypothetical protein